LLPVEASHIITGSGAGPLIDAVSQAICDDGDAILVPGPCWGKCLCGFVAAGEVSLMSYVGGYNIRLSLHGNIKVVMANPSSFHQACTDDILPTLQEAYSSSNAPIKALLVPNPHHPLGRCYSADVIKQMMRFCAERRIHYISDEIYGLSTLPESEEDAGPVFVSALTLADETLIPRSRLHIVYGISKDFGSSGLRLVRYLNFIRKFPSLHKQGILVSQSNPLLLVAAVAGDFWQTALPSALYTRSLLKSSYCDELLKLGRARLQKNYETITSRLRSLDIEYIPCRAGYGIFARLAKDLDSDEAETQILSRLRKHGVAVSPRGYAGGTLTDRGWVKIAFAVPEETLVQGLDRIEQALRKKP
jgi:gliotoxin/aspirochlorine biosynthesis aminotransferase